MLSFGGPFVCVRSVGRAGPQVDERRHFAEAVCAALGLPCGARSPRRAHKLAPENTGAQTVCARPRFAGQPRPAVLLSASEARRHSPTRDPAGTGFCLLRTATVGCSKAGVDGCSGAYAALMQCARTQNSPCGLFCAWRTPWRLQAPGPGVQRGQSDVFVGPARRIYAMARSAPLRSHRSRDAERVGGGRQANSACALFAGRNGHGLWACPQGTDAEGGGAASKLLRPSAPALPRHKQHTQPSVQHP